jgi:hypothetical protein
MPTPKPKKDTTQYDSDGNPIRKKQGPTTTVVDGFRELNQYDDNGKLIQRSKKGWLQSPSGSYKRNYPAKETMLKGKDGQYFANPYMYSERVKRGTIEIGPKNPNLTGNEPKPLARLLALGQAKSKASGKKKK